MPELDAIYRSVAALRAALLGHATFDLVLPRTMPGLRPRIGAIIERVDVDGRQVEIGWDDGTVLHTNLRLAGVWHLYRKGEGWRRPVQQSRVVVETESHQAVCFNAPIVETYLAHDFLWHPNLGRLGPDLALRDVDLDDCVARIGRFCRADDTVAQVLLDQRVVSGVGNVWKSETLWVSGVHPHTALGALVPEQKFYLLATASRLVRANLDNLQRVTSPEIGGLAVYGRHRLPCYRCGESIEVIDYGQQVRVTYWCPGCQVYLPYDEPARSEPTVVASESTSFRIPIAASAGRSPRTENVEDHQAPIMVDPLIARAKRAQPDS